MTEPAKPKPFFPMGAVMWEPEQCTFPKMASLKRDGIRVEIINGDLFAKSMKPLRNKNLRTHFQALLDLHALTGIVFEGEIYSHECKFKDIQSVVNSEDKPIPEHFMPSIQPRKIRTCFRGICLR